MAGLPDGHTFSHLYGKVWFQERWFLDAPPHTDMEEHILALTTPIAAGRFSVLHRTRLPNGSVVVVFQWKNN